MTTPVRLRDRALIMNALRAGVVPGRGLEHLQVGLGVEVEAIVQDIRTVKDSGTAVRVVVGEYGSGKTFFLRVVRNAAHKAGCITMGADVSQDARLYGTGGRVRSLYSMLMASTATKSQPEGGAIAEVLERLVASATQEASKQGVDAEQVIRHRLFPLTQHKGGPAFTDVVIAYWRAVRRDDDEQRDAAVRWLRGEYRTRTEARETLGVRSIIEDADLYPTLRLLAALVDAAGYGGLVVVLDEMSVLSRLNRQVRDQNYEQILTIVNSLLSGYAQNLMVVFSGTPEFMTDPVRGLHSYGALRQRFGGNEFLRPGMVDVASPVITLQRLIPEDLHVLMENVHRVFTSNGHRDPLPDRDAAIRAFLDHAANQLGGLSKVTPREVTRSWLQLLDALDQNRDVDVETLLGGVTIRMDVEDGQTSLDAGGSDDDGAGGDDPTATTGDQAALADFRL